MDDSRNHVCVTILYGGIEICISKLFRDILHIEFSNVKKKNLNHSICMHEGYELARSWGN